ncbi:MAG: S1/P1 nuclease [Rhizobiaceae bacterium]|nr:S1/P1 nuclease [Rhizobiaceae bacterium]
MAGAALLTLIEIGAAQAWSGAGHEIVADIAAAQLKPEARKAVDALLAGQHLSTMAQASGWADVVRLVVPEGQPSHLVRLPLDGSPYDEKRDCDGQRCVVAAIGSYAAVLRDAQAPAAAKVAALNYVIHLVGDVHQPLHASADPGKRMVSVAGRTMRLHDLWDEAIIGRRGKPPLELARSITASAACRAEPSLDPAGWAVEGRDIARDVIFGDPRLKSDADVPDLGVSYLDERWPVVRARLLLAGCRLGALLNSIFVRTGDVSPTNVDVPVGEDRSG